MTTYYVDSAAGSNTAPYDTWAKAATTLSTVLGVPTVSGDNVYVASTHAETSAGAITLNPVNTGVAVICADKTSGAPPATIATGASITSTGTGNQLGFSVSGCYFYGIAFLSGKTGSDSVGLLCAPHYFEQCSFQLTGAASTLISIGNAYWRNCTVKFSHAGQNIYNAAAHAGIWSGGSLLAGGTSPTALFLLDSGGGGPFLVEDIDLSAASASVNICENSGSKYVMMRNIKLPSSWSGTFSPSNPTGYVHRVLLAADASGTNYLMTTVGTFGTVKQETVLIKSGGASDGVTAISWKLVSVATTPLFPCNYLDTGEIRKWNDTTGSSITVTVDILRDSVTNLKNDEVWLELRYLGATGSPIGSLVSSAKANALATAADLTASSATWTTTGMANPNKQKMSVTFTPQLKGYLSAVVKLAKASTTIYVDPKLVVT